MSIGEAIDEKLAALGHDTTLNMVRADTAFAAYRTLYRYLPLGNAIPYNLAKLESINKAVQISFKKTQASQVAAIFSTKRFDLVISCIHFANPALTEWCKTHQVPLINVVTDPRATHPLGITEIGLNSCFDQESKDMILSAYPERTNVEPHGWFVRSVYEAPYSQDTVARSLKLDPSIKTIVVASGSEGITTILPLIPSLLLAELPVQLIVCCGSNTTLYKTVQALAKTTNRINSSHLIPLPFVTDLHRYMQAADLIIGKAGPNTIFEAVATHTPFVATTHIGGQESGNLELIESTGIGLVERNPLTRVQQILDLVADDDKRNAFQPALKKLAKYNRESAKRLDRAIAKILRVA